jgi:hypothetical protein
MERAGIGCAVVRADAFAPNIEHRRVIWAHMCAHNANPSARLLYAASGVAALYSFHADVVEFREAATGRLVALSLFATYGGYCAGPLYAARPEVARAGLWCARGGGGGTGTPRTHQPAANRAPNPPPPHRCRITNAHAIMEQLLAGGPLAHVRLFDVGPSFGELKQMMGLQPLRWRRVLAVAAMG